MWHLRIRVVSGKGLLSYRLRGAERNLKAAQTFAPGLSISLLLRARTVDPWASIKDERTFSNEHLALR